MDCRMVYSQAMPEFASVSKVRWYFAALYLLGTMIHTYKTSRKQLQWPFDLIWFKILSLKFVQNKQLAYGMKERGRVSEKEVIVPYATVHNKLDAFKTQYFISHTPMVLWPLYTHQNANYVYFNLLFSALSISEIVCAAFFVYVFKWKHFAQKFLQVRSNSFDGCHIAKYLCSLHSTPLRIPIVFPFISLHLFIYIYVFRCRVAIHMIIPLYTAV